MQFKIVSLFALMLASDAFASKVNYVMSYNGKNLEGAASTQKEKKAGGTIDDSKDALLLANMGIWSGGKFKATQHAATKIITVQNVNLAASQNAAIDMVTQARQLVNKNIK